MTRAYRPLLLPLTLALCAHALGCSGSDTDTPGEDATATSSSSAGGNPTGGTATTGGGTATTGGGNPTGGTATTGGDTATTGGGTTEKFSFFVTSLVAMRELSGSQDGFGGDLRFGETGPGAGLRGADKICATIAEKSLPGAGSKTWRAFLSAVAGEDGNQVDAIDRIGEGPWYDRLGRLVASNKQELLNDRPVGADEAIMDDLPNEDGVPNHQPDPSQPEVDNHDTMTGTNEQGRLYGATATCKDWTSAAGDRSEGTPRLGHSWPRNFGGRPGGGGPGGDINMARWTSAHDAAGCSPGVNLVDTGGPQAGSTSVGSGGGYGGIYCFALTP
ncbi:uncharacterized protein SOCE26_048400 [Sorangium cellulosum]|uniref:Secreted protein n=1 Tax=Sorangium cellulosum TaxID=56 RepID=A0A2L0EVU3_SORCE|nr:hypothetical protein [Sorangium cellulosum]AUX43392.1 uncharacterized protein SOCE26_048400 [Sorangium cellulosum]